MALNNPKETNGDFDAHPSYEEQWTRVGRVLRRVARWFRWRWKGLLRHERCILIELRWRLGDEVMALPILNALDTQYSRCRIEVLCNYPDLFTAHPSVDEVNPSRCEPDRYILLRGARRDRFRLAEYAAAARVEVPFESPLLYFPDEERMPDSRIPDGEGALVVLAAGASWPTKRWPKTAWSELGNKLGEGGARIVELGVGEEAIGQGTNLVGATTVKEAASILCDADLLVSSDSGLMHLALATGTPVVALFGPTDPEILIRGNHLFHPLINGRDCAGCWNTSQDMTTPGICPLNIDSCMGALSVDDVLRAVESLLAGGS